MRNRVCFILLTVLSLGCYAQTGSPSSRFGYGEMVDNVPAEFRAMGGVHTALRSNHTICPSQPAAYTAGDSLSFMFDIAAGLGWTNYRDSYGTKNVPMGSLEYITMQFPLWKRWISFSCGVMPFTFVKYNFSPSTTPVNDVSYTVTYQGEGGFSQVYAGLGFNILDWFAVGANFYYIFGTTTNYTVLSFTDSDISGLQVLRYMDLNAFRTTVGVQFFHTFANKHDFVLGATFEPKLPLKGNYLVTEINTLDTAIIKNGCDVPMQWSVGASYTWNHRLLVSADYSFQQWSDAYYYDQKGYLYDRHKVSFGAQYQHNLYGMKYHERMLWRLGASVMNNYALSTDWNDFTISLGVGFPLRTTATVINTTFEYGQKNSLAGMKEHNMKFIIDVAINEQWFHKRKL